MPAKKAVNPFYIVLVLVGACFGITAMAYASATTIAQQNPELAADSRESGHGLIGLMDQYGERLMMIELGALAITTVLAITTDSFWARADEDQ